MRLGMRKLGLICALAGTVSACSDNLTPEGIADPLEPVNRTTHAVNKGVDTLVLRPVSQAYGAITPDPVENSVANAVNNLGEPSNAVNHILQGDPGKALNTIGRFGVNSTIGIAGLFDPATELGLVAETTDFGQTLHVWGAEEGAYLELPLLGPSTARDATGRVVDFILDPVNALVPDDELAYCEWCQGGRDRRYAEAVGKCDRPGLVRVG